MTSPADVARSFFDHHLWATRSLIDALASMDPGALDGAIPGTYGSIAETLAHLVDADDRYLVRLEQPTLPPYEDHGAQPLDVLRTRVDGNAVRWSVMLDRLEAGTLEAAIKGREDFPDTEHAETLLLLQAIHHGNDHRTQVCSTLGALGAEVPDLDGWSYVEQLDA